MSWYVVDLRERVGQRVTPEAEAPDPQGERFYKVRADSLREALAEAKVERDMERGAAALRV